MPGFGVARRLALLASLALHASGLGCGGAAATALSPNGSGDSPIVHIADADLDRGPSAVASEDAEADLDNALYLFEQAYAGIDGRPRTPSPTRVAEVRARIRAIPIWQPLELATVLRDLLRQPDGHLAFGYSGPEPLRLAAWPTQAHSSSFEDAPVSAVTLSDGDVPVLRIRSFDNKDVAAMRSLPALAERLRRSREFVVDLRGNGGGNYGFAEAFILALTDRDLLRLHEREVVSVAASEGRANAVRRQIASGLVPQSALPHFHEHLDALRAETDALHDQGARRTEVVTRGATVHGRAPGPLRARAVFLVDGGCASACEMMLALARQIPNVVVAGQNTRGGMAVGELAYFRLPHSGVTISLGTRAFADPLGDFQETRGFVPDVALAGDHPVELAKALASEPSVVTRHRLSARETAVSAREGAAPDRAVSPSTIPAGAAR